MINKRAAYLFMKFSCLICMISAMTRLKILTELVRRGKCVRVYLKRVV